MNERARDRKIKAKTNNNHNNNKKHDKNTKVQWNFFFKSFLHSIHSTWYAFAHVIFYCSSFHLFFSILFHINSTSDSIQFYVFFLHEYVCVSFCCNMCCVCDFSFIFFIFLFILIVSEYESSNYMELSIWDFFLLYFHFQLISFYSRDMKSIQ